MLIIFLGVVVLLLIMMLVIGLIIGRATMTPPDGTAAAIPERPANAKAPRTKYAAGSSDRLLRARLFERCHFPGREDQLRRLCIRASRM